MRASATVLRSLSGAAAVLLAAGCERAPLIQDDPGPAVVLARGDHFHQPCIGGWCAHTIVVSATDSATGAPVAVELALSGAGRYPSPVYTMLPDGEASIDWEFPHQDGTFTLSFCVARDPGNCLPFRLTRSPAP